MANHAADLIGSFDRARGIAVLQCASSLPAHHTADLRSAVDRAGRRAVFHRAFIHPTLVRISEYISGCAADAVPAADRAGEAAVFHRAVVDTAEQPGAIQR